MKDMKKIVTPGKGIILIGENGEKLVPPRGWKFQPAGDAGVTRKITAGGIYWRVQVKKGRRTISKGVWAPAATVDGAVEAVNAARSTDTYRKRIESDRKRREKKQSAYEVEFLTAVRNFLDFAPAHREVEGRLAEAVTAHAIPVGSGTVARTAMIPIEERAQRAVIAWMRHRTTAYDTMSIPRVKGKRREVRRILAKRSAELLEAYRKGGAVPGDCVLASALEKS